MLFGLKKKKKRDICFFRNFDFYNEIVNKFFKMLSCCVEGDNLSICLYNVKVFS